MIFTFVSCTLFFLSSLSLSLSLTITLSLSVTYTCHWQEQYQGVLSLFSSKSFMVWGFNTQVFNPSWVNSCVWCRLKVQSQLLEEVFYVCRRSCSPLTPPPIHGKPGWWLIWGSKYMMLLRSCSTSCLGHLSVRFGSLQGSKPRWASYKGNTLTSVLFILALQFQIHACEHPGSQHHWRLSLLYILAFLSKIS